ncbi:ester cyclase [Minwuia sp.]|uniref:ester cyclase n=1 Tax=Minwuia sp. TaxID=2493630 RepID=UPI003A923CA1
MQRTPHQIMETYLHDIAGGGKLELIDEIAQPDMIDEANQAFGGPPGRDGLVAHVVGFHRNITERRIRIRKIVAGKSDVMAWWSFTGRHTGPWLGRTPTGEEISADVFSFFELTEGRVSLYRLWLCAQFDTPVLFDSARADNTR